MHSSFAELDFSRRSSLVIHESAQVVFQTAESVNEKNISFKSKMSTVLMSRLKFTKFFGNCSLNIAQHFLFQFSLYVSTSIP